MTPKIQVITETSNRVRRRNESYARIILLPSSEGIITHGSSSNEAWGVTRKFRAVRGRVLIDENNWFDIDHDSADQRKKPITLLYQYYERTIQELIAQEWLAIRRSLVPVVSHPELTLEIVEKEVRGISGVYESFEALSPATRRQILVGLVSADVVPLKRDPVWDYETGYLAHPNRANLDLLSDLRDFEGQIIGYHGTSASIARQIVANGFTNQLCVEGANGVWFWDGRMRDTAHYNGVRKAEELRERKYAVISARLDNPEPDRKGRLQWLATADRIHLLSVDYFSVKQDRPFFLSPF